MENQYKSGFYNPEQSNKKPNFWLPLIAALAVGFGILIGLYLQREQQPNFLPSISISKNSKIGNILRLIDRDYVDTVSFDSLEEKVIANLLNELDPFSSYIPASHLSEVNEPLEGNFDGIGIEFQLVDDTVVVLSVISGGPSEKAGLLSGDKILKVNNDTLSGKLLKSADVVKLVRGPKNTTAILEVKRGNRPEVLKITVERGKIPLFTVDASFLIEESIGYIKLNKFGATTKEEIKTALLQLNRAGMQKLILDLRDNPGGYLDAAIGVADEFLESNKIITYTQGRNRKKQSFYATEDGRFISGSLAILMDEASASASEIVAGALQDHDRAFIIGRRSFGKGLVQEQIPLSDGSAVRLTVSRYFTPVGRSIQKPYTKGDYQDLYDWEAAYNRGEFSSPDSISFSDSVKFTTQSGKVVFGGGGIMPDLFLPIDTNQFPRWLFEVTRGGPLSKWIQAEINIFGLEKPINFDEWVKYFSLSEAQLKRIIAIAKEQGVHIGEPTNNHLKELSNGIKAGLARHWFGSKAYYQVIESFDPMVQKAVEWLKMQE